jgi:predicted ATPase
MRLSSIELQNFRGIGASQTIELKPITLLFGANSAGKSTIIQALHYLREILERHNVNPDLTIAGGSIDLGGFSSLVHNHELDRAIRIKVEIDVGDEQGPDELPLNSGTMTDEPGFEEAHVRYLLGESLEHKDYAIVQTVGLNAEIRWSELNQSPYVSELGIELDTQPLAKIISPPQEGRAQLTDFNFKHPLLQAVIDPDDTEPHSEVPSPLENLIWELSREVALDTPVPTPGTQLLRIAVRSSTYALPNLDHEIELEIRDPLIKKVELEEKTPRVAALRRLLDEMILGPARLVRNYLAKMTYLGPLREIPSRNYKPQVSPDQARWANGLAAWDLLYSDRSAKLIDDVNFWLSDSGRLDAGYRVERIEYKELPIPSRLNQLFERGIEDDDIAELEELYGNLQSRVDVALRDAARGIIVGPSDVGVGISQLVPVVVAALRPQNGLLAIEQPELHVHPAIQVAIGDLFIRAVRPDSGQLYASKTMLIETHSEHIMLRLLRRIRETSEGALPPDVDPLLPKDLSVIYVEGDENGVRFYPLRVDSEGEFVDRWPKGFFGERGKELF